MSVPNYAAQGTPAYSSVPPLWAPYYGASLREAVRRFFKKYATFSGRASRSEYWWWMLVNTAVVLVLEIVTFAGGVTTTSSSSSTGATTTYGQHVSATGPGAVIGSLLLVLWGLAVLVPSLALLARRLHDANMSAWMMLLGLVPFVGGLALLVITLLGPNPAGVRFDRAPAGPYAAAPYQGAPGAGV